MELLYYTVRRLAALLPVLIGTSIVVFAMVRLLPGDPAEVMAGMTATREMVEEFREMYRLNDPLHVQYFGYMRDLLQGDMGRSIWTGNQVAAEINDALPVTLRLTVMAMTLAMLMGVAAGVVAASRRNRPADYLTMTVALLGLSIPSYWLALMLMVVFSVDLNWLPSAGLDTPAHYVLPVFTMSLASAAIVARMSRSAMLEVLGQDYIRTARAKGLAQRVVIFRHALRNALVSITTVIGIQFGFLLSGAVVLETVFSINGIGRLLIERILARDYPTVQGAVLVAAVLVVLLNLLVDLCYALIDPRIRYA